MHARIPDASRRVTVVALLLLFVVRCGDTFQQDELDCEEAVSVLVRCCPGVTSSSFECIDTQGGCAPEVPQISETESACVRSESCAQLVSSGVCGNIGGLGSGGQLCP